jgi:hypothetical protein
MIFTASQFFAHLIGDYLFQSSWMAENKTKTSLVCIVHVVFYSLPFLFLNPSLPAYALITTSHFIIDRWSLAKYVVWAHNLLGSKKYRLPFSELHTNFGFSADIPLHQSFWLYVIIDNIMHLFFNALAFTLFP